ncbi:hypothetical protein HYS54_03220 [Candidatus Micrarchaeota archaeon]|nr:hypothetical protein [Candidatus Micrarchaeota archaeon]
MKFGIVEYGQKLSNIVEKEISEEVANCSFVKKQASDLFDLLAFARKLSQETDQVIMLVELEEEQKAQNDAFYNGLAVLEAETGKPIFKLVYQQGEAGEKEARKFARSILEQLFGKKKEEETTTEEDIPELGEEEEDFELEGVEDEDK